MTSHGLAWDGPVLRQSRNAERYRNALAELKKRCFACRCTRRQLHGHERYPGTCRDAHLPLEGNSLRIRANAPATAFEDRVQGRVTPKQAALDDFIVRRRDGFVSYPLAVVVDDEAAGVTQVVRGADLLDNTHEQLFLMDCLGIDPPAYAHLPVIAEAGGVKLSKHNRATAIEDRQAPLNLAAAMSLIGLHPPLAPVDEMLDWAVGNWDITRIPATATISGFVATT